MNILKEGIKMPRINIALHTVQSDYRRPVGIISIQESQLVEVKTVIHSANAMYDNQYLEEGTAEERVDYIIEALHEAGLDVENVFTSVASNIYL